MLSKYKLFAFLLLISLTYILQFYLVLTHKQRLDFSSFYSSTKAWEMSKNPYQVLTTSYLPTVEKLPVNLNPPFFLWLTKPFSHLSYYKALTLWYILSFIAGLVGAGLVFKLTFSAAFYHEYKLYLYLTYLSLFSTLANAAIVQVGAFLLFFIMLGFYFYKKGNDLCAGFFWGLITALKLFPALLFFYMVLQKRYKLALTFSIIALILSLIPWFNYGSTIYREYFSMLPRVLWHGDNWNASFYGYIFRLFMHIPLSLSRLSAIRIIYVLLFTGTLLWYLKKTRHAPSPEYAFALTLICMLLMSPLGWIYYFSLLLFPFCLGLQGITQDSSPLKNSQLWGLLSLFLLNFPIGYKCSAEMPSYIDKLTIFSFHFYGLLILSYLFAYKTKLPNKSFQLSQLATFFIPTFYIILAFGLFSPLIIVLRNTLS